MVSLITFHYTCLKFADEKLYKIFFVWYYMVMKCV
jgi:hypothetical protein